jgi:hypothetical protein
MLIYRNLTNGLVYCQYGEDPITTITNRGKNAKKRKKRDGKRSNTSLH